MTAPQQPPAGSIDMARVAERAAENAMIAAAPLASQLSMAQEVAQARAARIADLEKQLEERNSELAEKTAELARSGVAADQLRDRLAELEAAAAGTLSEDEEGGQP